MSSLWSLILAVILNYGIWFGFMYTDRIVYDGMIVRYINWISIFLVFIYVCIISVYQNILLGRFTPYQIMRGENND